MALLSSSISAIILAGGLGTRLRAAVSTLPKPMAPIDDRPFLEYLLDYWITQGIRHFVLSVGYRHEMIIDYFGDNFKEASLEYVIEASPLGTGGALLLASKRLPDSAPFLVLNGDTFFAIDLKALIHFFHQQDADWAFSLFQHHQNDRYLNMEVSPEGQIVSLQSTVIQESPLMNGGVYLVNPRALKDLTFDLTQAVSLENDIFPVVLSSGQRLFGLASLSAFIDIGIPEDYLKAHEILKGIETHEICE